MNTPLFPVVILAGGLATRLRPITANVPKSMIAIHGEPFIAHQLRLLKKNHIADVIICLGYLGEMIMDYVGNGEDFGLNVSYSSDGATPLGTGGAVKKATRTLKHPFFVLYGDSYLPCQYATVQQQFIDQKKLGLMTVFHNQGQWDSSNVVFANQQILAYDKIHKTTRMKHIDYGLGIFETNAFDLIENTTFDLAELYQKLLQQHQLAAMEITERFYESGSFSGIDELTHYLAAQTQ